MFVSVPLRPLYTREVKEIPQRYRPVLNALLLSNGVSVCLFLIRATATNTSDYWFMLWNLCLGLVPIGLMLVLLRHLNTHSWREPLSVIMTLVWLSFLPNSFYMISDLIHLDRSPDISVLYDAVLLLSFLLNGMIAGFLSMVLLHRALLKRRPAHQAHMIIVAVILLVSFAIYLGRTLRWNSWSIITNPGGLIYDVSERVINPFTYPQAITTTVLFFLLLGSSYLVVWRFTLLLTKKS